MLLRIWKQCSAKKTDFGSKKEVAIVEPATDFEIMRVVTRSDFVIEESASYWLSQRTMVSTIAEVVVEAIVGSALTPIGPGVDIAIVELDPYYH